MGKDTSYLWNITTMEKLGLDHSCTKYEKVSLRYDGMKG